MISGLDVAEAVVPRASTPTRAIERLGPEGEWREAGAAGAARSRARARALLTAERTALNFLGRLSGVATLTARVRARGRGRRRRRRSSTRARPRPGCGALEKAAVAAGGGVNHRAGLYDAILIKENHAALAGGVGEAVRRARAARPDLPLEVEVRDAGGDRRGARGGRAAAAARQHDARARCARRSRRSAGRAELEASRRRDARDSSGLCDHRRARLRLDGCADPLRPRPRPLPRSWSRSLNMTLLLTLENIPALQDEVRALAARARRRDPRPQLPAARGPGRGRLRRRLARPLAAGGGAPTPT